MNESAKTLTFAGVAIFAMVVAVVARPKLPEADVDSPVGTQLNKVDDPLRATHLKIVEFVEDSSSLRPFEVEKIDNRWVIPSHNNYPADAEQQMADAATSVMNLEILGIVSTSTGDHETYGVIEPNAQKLEVGATGVGMQVTMEDADGKALVDMIIGKEVKDQDNQRYVREVGRDAVYQVKLDTSHLKTEFGDWIEKDLLKLSPWDIREVQLTKDNVVGARSNVGIVPVRQQQSLLNFRYNDKDSKWEVIRLAEGAGEQSLELKDVPPPAGQELDSTKLNDLKNALDDLKIVDVERKPDGLSADLRADKNFAENREVLENLGRRGFVPVVADDSAIEIVSAQGETICRMKDGVEYLLRFGDLRVGDRKSQGDEDGSAKSAIDRYMFVTARVNKDLIEKPELAEVPSADVEVEPAEEPAAEAATDAKPADEAAPEEASPPADAAATEEGQATEAEAGDSGPEGEEGEAGEAAPQQEAAADESAEKPEPSAEEKARQKIIEENSRKQKEYDDKVEKAEEKVKELNERFADWYYVVADDVYKKVQLERKDLFKAPEGEEGEVDDASPASELGDLSPLTEEGLKSLDAESPAEEPATGEEPAETEAVDSEAPVDSDDASDGTSSSDSGDAAAEESKPQPEEAEAP
ncbi:MAG: DUF4340 domain-containing protein [Planctomycetales bacterium]|nr:DUF4340 domain-containing protein [Planctomycetales bacterium]